jgi:hypothetical protein
LEGMTWSSSPCGQVFHCDPPLFHKNNLQWSAFGCHNCSKSSLYLWP